MSSSGSESGKFIDFDAGRDDMVAKGFSLLREVDMSEGIGSKVVLEDGRVYVFSSDVRYRGRVMTEWLLDDGSDVTDDYERITEMEWFGKRLSPVSPLSSSSDGGSAVLFPDNPQEDEDDVAFGARYGAKAGKKMRQKDVARNAAEQHGSSDDTDVSDPLDVDYSPSVS